ncbi:MAG: cupin domain-containing protein [Ahniella sp.]|nr:cupin domain-containing protein [Ahniella sp.]
MTSNLLNADFSQRVVLPPPTDGCWVPSPEPGVHRYRLDRIGDEVARATSMVRYAPGSHFARHVHGGGEEFLVLDGIFSDERGDYPAGSYVRNPPGTAHTPFSREGCTLFVKLWQFAPGDDEPVHIDTANTPWRQGLVPGLSVMPLHEFDGVSSALVRWAPHTQFNTHTHPGGEEILVLQGLFRDEQGEYPAGSWLRSPRWSRHTPFTGSEGALIYVKVGHLGATFLTPTASVGKPDGAA